MLNVHAYLNGQIILKILSLKLMKLLIIINELNIALTIEGYLFILSK